VITWQPEQTDRTLDVGAEQAEHLPPSTEEAIFKKKRMAKFSSVGHSPSDWARHIPASLIKMLQLLPPPTRTPDEWFAA
jgi:hypothetical protein